MKMRNTDQSTFTSLSRECPPDHFDLPLTMSREPNASTSYTLPPTPPAIPLRPAAPAPDRLSESAEPEIIESIPVPAHQSVSSQPTAKRRALDIGDGDAGEDAKRRKVARIDLQNDDDDDIQLVE